MTQQFGPTAWQRRGAIWRRETGTSALLVAQKPTSFLAAFDYSVNPLAGCPFACLDCYVPALPNVIFRKDRLPDGRETRLPSAWGDWVEVRTRSIEVLAKALDRGVLTGKTLFMSPLSDVYWPGERRYLLTRGLLELLADRPVVAWLNVSTRSDLVLRDLDLYQTLGEKAEVGISIPTDREDISAVVARRNPSIARRFQAVEALVQAGIPTRVHVSPLQPHSPDFARRLAATGAWVWLDWHTHFAAGFRAAYEARGLEWSTPKTCAEFAAELAKHMPAGWVRTGQRHFADRARDVQGAA